MSSKFTVSKIVIENKIEKNQNDAFKRKMSLDFNRFHNKRDGNSMQFDC
jgi:hypothetical protein